MTNYIDPKDRKPGGSRGCFAIIIAFMLLVLALTSCRTVKHIESTRVNTDSLVNSVKDSMSEVHSKETTELRWMIEEMTSSGVTFTVDSCPERSLILGLLDSTGKANYEKMMLERKIKDLTNKVTISEKGMITAEGNIKSAFFTSGKLQEELFRNELTIDQFVKTNDSLRVELNKAIEEKTKHVVKKSGFPWIIFWLCMSGATFLGWWARGKLHRRFNDVPAG